MFMKEFRWNALKSQRLKKTRGVSFEEVLKGKILALDHHHNRENQRLMLIDYKGYIWLVPYVREETGLFLKTLYPSRKYTKLYRKRG